MNTEEFFLKENKKMVKIMLAEVLYIESFKDYMCFHFRDKNIKVRVPLWSIEERLDKSKFIRVHKSFIVAIKQIDTYSSTFLEINGQRIPIGRTYRKQTAAVFAMQLPIS